MTKLFCKCFVFFVIMILARRGSAVVKKFLEDILGFLYALSMGDYFFLIGTFLLILALIYIIYIIKRDDCFMDEKRYEKDGENDSMDILSICEKIESEYKPSTIELTSYEEEQENNAIISYDELVKNKNANTIKYDQEYKYNSDELSVKKINIEEYKLSEKCEKEIELKVKLMNYDKEEAFLKALKQLQQNLTN